MAPVTRSQTSLPRHSIDSPTPRSFDEPPRYTVDLSAPPRTRYRHICRDNVEQLRALTSLFDEVLALTAFPRLLKHLARIFLKRVYSSEETEEIRGIAREAGISVHLVVAYNTFLDLFSGCISGAVRADAGDSHDDQHRMLHFRGLDWDMEELRKLIISVDYIRDGTIIARGVTYAGYIGTLTGVREGLSISFNYRARMDEISTFAQRLHPILLLFGFRASIPSVLRRILLAPGPPPTLSELAETFPSIPSSPGYITFCSPDGVLVVEKDYKTAVIHHSHEFLAVTNHDTKVESWDPDSWEETLKQEGPDIGGMQALLEDSVVRKGCVARMFVETSQDRRPDLDDVTRWISTKPVLNETTHFSCIMAPEGGRLLWVHAYDTPVSVSEDLDDSDSSFEG